MVASVALVAALASGGIALGVHRAATRSSSQSQPALASAAAPSASAAATPLPLATSSALPPSPFVFDCADLPQSSASCAGALPAAEKLVSVASWVSVTGAQPCATGLDGDRAERAAHALRAAQPLAQQKLAPLERAILQNAALRLLSCSSSVEPKTRATEIARDAKALVKSLALSPEEIAALPGTSKGLEPWLGELGTWQRGTVRSHVHEKSDGDAATLQRVKRGEDYASVARLILVDGSGELHATDVVSKVTRRRGRDSDVHVCIARVDVASAHCDTYQLRALSADEGALAIHQTLPLPPCSACHVDGAPNTKIFGPTLGIGPDAVNLDEAREPLLHALAQ